MEVVVQRDGCVRCVYGESIDLSAIGQLSIHRGSDVEPTADGKWTADLAPAGGPLLGPFNHRSEALAAEREWLERNWLCQT
jgi:hypothetical protein